MIASILLLQCISAVEAKDISEEYPAANLVVSASAPSSYSLTITRYKQEKDQWCWAAIAKMIGVYTGHNCTQSNIVKYVKGSVINKPATNSETAKAIKYATGSSYSVSVLSAISLDEIVNMIGVKKLPLGMRMAWNSFYGHYLVIGGYNRTKGTIKLIDPWENTASTYYPYADLINEITIHTGTGYYSNTFQLS